MQRGRPGFINRCTMGAQIDDLQQRHAGRMPPLAWPLFGIGKAQCQAVGRGGRLISRRRKGLHIQITFQPEHMGRVESRIMRIQTLGKPEPLLSFG